jgi:hypothetical protein
MLIWGLCVIYRTLGRGVFFCRRCGGDREYRHRAGRRYVTVFFIPLIPLTKTGEHVQCLTCKIRYVTEVLKLPTTVQMQLAHVAGMRAMVGIILQAGDPASPVARRRALDAVIGTGDKSYDEDALEADLDEPADTARPKISALGAQLQIEAREWCLAEAIRIAMADGPLTGSERAAAEHLASALGMTQAQAIGVIALTEQNTVLSPGGMIPPGTPQITEGLRPSVASPREDGAKNAPPPALWCRSSSLVAVCRQRTDRAAWRCGWGWGPVEHAFVLAGILIIDMSHELLLLSGRGGGL